MMDGRQQRRIEPGYAGQPFRVHAIALLVIFVDQAEPSWIRDEHFVAGLLEEPTDPRRMRSSFDRDPCRRGGAEASAEGRPCRGHTALFHHSAAAIQDADATVLVTHIDPDRRPLETLGWLHGHPPSERLWRRHSVSLRQSVAFSSHLPILLLTAKSLG
jgi:hypothetical protein